MEAQPQLPSTNAPETSQAWVDIKGQPGIDSGGQSKQQPVAGRTWYIPLPKIMYGAGLAACDGFVNGNTKKRFDTFGGMMTGNTVMLGSSVADEKWISAALFICMIAGFFIGALIGWACEPRKKAGSFRYISLMILLCLVACEVLAFVIESADSARWASVLTAVAMGITDVVGFTGSLGQHVTFMTGNVQKLAQMTYNMLTFSRSKDKSKINTQLAEQKKISQTRVDFCTVGAIWAFYVAGALAGSLMSRAPNEGAWTLCLPAAVLTFLIWINEGPSSAAPEPAAKPPLFRLFDLTGSDTIDIVELCTVFAKLGLELTPQEESGFIAADADDSGRLDFKQFVAWIAA